MKHERECLSCKNKIKYKSAISCNRANKENSLCRSCSQDSRFLDSIKRHPELWIIPCTNCGNIKKYKSYESFFNCKRLKINKCGSCSSKEKSATPEGKKRLEEIRPICTGKKNGMYGKTPYDIWVEKYGILEANKKQKEWLKNTRSANSKSENSFSSRMNGMTTYDFWVHKFGKKEADKKMIKLKKKRSKQMSGVNNNMFGKPSPKGSGNGWSGWYKKWFFRSLRELSYVINVIERSKLEWKSAEDSKWKINYKDWDGKVRSYFPDFIINGKYLVECKPKRLWNSATVILKKEAAEIFCKKNNMIYKLVSPSILNEEEIKKLVNKKLIIFTDRYKIKFKERNLKG